MSDDALIAWLNAGAPAPLSVDEESARRRAGFVRLFSDALDQVDLGPTDELHEASMAALVYAVHLELNKLGEDEYSHVWRELPANKRRAIKAYVSMASKTV